MSIGLGLRMMQGGVDRTGFAKMADELGNPGLDLIAARRAAASQTAAMDEFAKRMEALSGNTGEEDELPIVPMDRDKLVFGPMFENLEGKTLEQVKADPNLELPVGGYDQIVKDYEMSIGEKMFGDDPISFMPGVKQSTATDLGIDALRYGIAPGLSAFYDVLKPTVMGDGTLYGNEFEFMPEELLNSMADGGRVGMANGGLRGLRDSGMVSTSKGYGPAGAGGAAMGPSGNQGGKQDPSKSVDIDQLEKKEEPVVTVQPAVKPMLDDLMQQQLSPYAPVEEASMIDTLSKYNPLAQTFAINPNLSFNYDIDPNLKDLSDLNAQANLTYSFNRGGPVYESLEDAIFNNLKIIKDF